MVQVLVLSVMLGPNQTNYYFFDSWIVKENIYNTEELNILIDNPFDLYDIERNLVYGVAFNKKFRKLKSTPNPGGWISTSKTLINLFYEKTTISGYNCVKVTEVIESQTPLGSTAYNIETYYADLSEYLLEYMKPDILKFLGVFEEKYYPYLFIITKQNVFPDGIPIPFWTAAIERKMVNEHFLTDLVSLPIVEEMNK